MSDPSSGVPPISGHHGPTVFSRFRRFFRPLQINGENGRKRSKTIVLLGARHFSGTSCHWTAGFQPAQIDERAGCARSIES